MNWAQEQRLNWIKEVLEVFGSLNRIHIMKKFRVSEPQSALDLKLFMKKNPGLMIYNAASKRYERKDD